MVLGVSVILAGFRLYVFILSIFNKFFCVGCCSLMLIVIVLFI